MLSIEQYQIIEEQLSKENAKEFVEVLLEKYANTVKNINELLRYIPKLAEKQLKIKQERIIQYSWSTDLLIGDRDLHPHKYKNTESGNQFCVLLYTCRSHFKSGNIEGQGKACKEFFNEFVNILKERKEFDYTDEKDWEWIYSTAKCADWLESVIKQNIDSEFVKPKINKINIYSETWLQY